MRIKTLTKTAMSAKGKLALTLISALGVLGATGALLVFGASTAKFSMTATPTAHTVTSGQTATFTVTLNRQNKFTSPVTLSASGYSGATKTFSPTTIPGSSNSSTLQVSTPAGATSTATHTITITGSGGGATSSTTVRLTVVPATVANFGLSATPTQSVISADDESTHQIDISRSNLSEPVALSLSGLPNGVTGEFDDNPVSGNGTNLVFTSDANPKPGTYPITVTGTAFAPHQITRSTSLTLVVEEKKPFGISGAAAQQLYPGRTVPLDLTLTNPHNFTLNVTDLEITVDPRTSNAGCGGAENYTGAPMADIPALALPAASTRTLSSLGVDPADMPSVAMNDRNADQDACKGASVHLHYTGTATK